MSQPEKIEADEYLRRLRALSALEPARRNAEAWSPPPRCPGLRSDESTCTGTVHYTGDADGRRACRQCPLVRLRAESSRLRELLQRCGADPAQPFGLSAQLLRSIDADRQVEGLRELIAKTTALVAAPPPAGHLLITGRCGLAKTHAQLAIHLACLERGVDSRWMDSASLRELAQQLDAFDEETRAAAQGRIRCIHRAKVIVFNDLADYESGRGDRYRLVLGTLLEHGGAAWVVSTNFPVRAERRGDAAQEMDLQRHPDVGERIVSRLISDRGGQPAAVINLRGPDQRMHAARLAHRAAHQSRGLA